MSCEAFFHQRQEAHCGGKGEDGRLILSTHISSKPEGFLSHVNA